MTETVYGAKRENFKDPAKRVAKGAKDATVVVVEKGGNVTVPDKSTTIVACVAGATLITYIGNVTTKQPLTIKPLLGGFVAGTLLLGVGMWSTEVASMFSVIMLVTSILINGKPIFQMIGRITG